MLNLPDMINTGKIYRNLPAATLVEMALSRNEGILTNTGALNILTGKYTGRSPDDKFIVDYPEIHDEINWGNVNKPISPERYEHLYEKLLAYLQNRDLFIFDGYVGADPEYRLKVRIINELASQNLFSHQLFINPSAKELENFEPDYTVIAAPGFHASPELDGTHSEAFILVNYVKKTIIIGGTSYCGEIKKSVFSVMNYILPHRDVLPMHCSANIGKDGDVALFFGLSGTGKTTLSADPDRFLIGDDEHGWSDNGVFNFEGGCYAKCINLSQESEPQIWNAIKFGAVLENVVVDENRNCDFNDSRYTENTRAAYPLYHIPNAVIPSIGGVPKNIVFLTADAFGVLPPISKLTKEQAMYYFLSGYTSKLAGTERGITEPQATFSTCFGAPFLPLMPIRYAELLGERIEKYNPDVWLVNTGWTGGPYGVGQRIKLKYTRAMISAALTGQLNNVEYVKLPVLNLMIPTTCPDVPADLLNPRNTWADKNAYDDQTKKLAARFIDNFKKFKGVSNEIITAGPSV